MRVTRNSTLLARYLPVLLLVFPLLTIAVTFYAALKNKSADVDACALYSETSLRDLTGYDGLFFHQSVDAAYQRLAEDKTPAPDFTGCWWRLGSEDDAFVMMQLQLFPVGDAEAKSRIDAQLVSASTMNSPLLPEALDALGEAALWSRLAGLVRWHRGDGIVLELMISEHVPHAQPGQSENHLPGLAGW